MTWKYTTVSMDTVRLSSVITGCGGNETTCSRRSIRALIRSRNGTSQTSPALGALLNRPSRSMTAACACGMTFTERKSTTTIRTTTTMATISTGSMIAMAPK